MTASESYLQRTKKSGKRIILAGREPPAARITGNELAVKHMKIAASAGDYREPIDSILALYNSSCAQMRSEARDS